jgi:uncharacterized protein YdgA (DUF945 family)
VKKGIVILLLALVLVVIISPGIVGRLAEQSVDENLDWAAQESRDLVVTSQKFDRGWFSSEGRHRVELKNGDIKNFVKVLLGTEDAAELPALIIDTRIDHGLIPVTSMTRDKGSLAPGLGNAISTLSLEQPDGEIASIPGTIYSSFGLTGDLTSNYVLEAGSFSEDGETADWGPVDIVVSADAAATAFEFSGSLESLQFSDDAESVSVTNVSLSGDQRPSGYGFYVGDVEYSVDQVTLETGGQQLMTLGPMSMVAETRIADAKLAGNVDFSLSTDGGPPFGKVDVILQSNVSGVDAPAFQALVEVLDSIDPAGGASADSKALLQSALKRVLAGGLQLNFDKLNLATDQGTLETIVNLRVKESDTADFEWSALLLATEADASIRVPEALMDFVIQMNPQAGAVVGMGYLKKNGDVYEMQAALKKGLLTINGAPMVIPLP